MEQKTAVVTGGSSGIGEAFVKALIQRGYRVYGIARNFEKQTYTHPDYHLLPCDVTDMDELNRTAARLKQTEKSIHVLINNAGVGYFAPHNQLSPDQISRMVLTNLQAPLVFTRLLLPGIINAKGSIINVSSITAKKASPHGAVYGATKAALAHFSESLFDEVRKTGVKVTCLYPDIVRTPFYDHLSFREGDAEESYITPECVADALTYVLEQRSGTLVTELTLRPQIHRITKKKAPE